MASSIFDNWLKSWHKQLQTEKRKAAFLADNCSAHKPTIFLENVSIFFLLPNTTSVLQLRDMGNLGWSENNFFFDINLQMVRKLGKWTKNTIKSVFVGLYAETPVLPLSSDTTPPNFQKFAVIFDSDIAET